MNHEFCPSNCNNTERNERICTADGGCWHTHDRKYDKPIKTEMIWYANVWVQALIIGESRDKYIVENSKTGRTYINKTSPLLRENYKEPKRTKMSLEEAKEIAQRDGWSKKLGYSKKKLGIETPKR